MLALVAFLAGCNLAAESGRFDPLRVLQPGCSSGEFRLLVDRRGLSGGRYLVRTEVTAEGRHYMDELATIHLDGATEWRLYDDHSFAPAAAAARWPLPRGTPLRIDFSLRRPAGQVVDRQSLLIEDCASGRIRFRTAVMADSFE